MRHFGLFPQTPFAVQSGALSAGRVPPDPEAAECSAPAHDISTWSDVSIRLPGQATLRLPLPPFLAQSDWDHRIPHILASFHDPKPGLDPSANDLMITHETVLSYATIGTAERVRQTHVLECRYRQTDMWVLEFDLHDDSCSEDSYYMSAVRAIGPGEVLSFSGKGATRQYREQLISAALAARITA